MTLDEFFAEAKRLNIRMIGTPEEVRAALDTKDAEIRQLRKLLAVRVAGAALYTDDGELQDNSQIPAIDFYRDSLQEIERKLKERAVRKASDDAYWGQMPPFRRLDPGGA